MTPAFCITAKSLFTTLDVSDMVTDKVSDIYCRQPTPHKTITYWFSIIFLSDILPTCLRHFSPTFTSALPPLLPPHYRQNNICTDILHRHFTPTKQHQPSAFTDQLQIDYFPQIIPKERRRRRSS